MSGQEEDDLFGGVSNGNSEKPTKEDDLFGGVSNGNSEKPTEEDDLFGGVSKGRVQNGKPLFDDEEEGEGEEGEEEEEEEGKGKEEVDGKTLLGESSKDHGKNLIPSSEQRTFGPL